VRLIDPRTGRAAGGAAFDAAIRTFVWSSRTRIGPSREPLARYCAVMGGPHPSGTVTFLFTDVEDSTVLWDRSKQAMTEALAHHDRLVTGAIGEWGGYVFASGGDGFAAAFASASDAAAAAVDAQRELVAQRWPEDAQLRVRMGLHTGTAHERDGDYFGTVVNRAARIGAAGHGGQVLVSAATAELLADDEWSLVDLGEHHLKGLTRAEHLFRLQAEGMAEVDLTIRVGRSGAAIRLLGGLKRWSTIVP
jgi:class 3 adenylate cyclase